MTTGTEPLADERSLRLIEADERLRKAADRLREASEALDKAEREHTAAVALVVSLETQK